jgi:Transposase DDE domain group 1
LRENLTSSSYGEGLETGRASAQIPRQPFTRQNRIKEQLMLFSDRTSTHYLRSNQLRLYFSSIAYVLLQMLRRLGLEGTELAKAQCSTIRLKLLKIGALVRITVRKVWISLAGGYPYVALFKFMRSCAPCR